MVVESRITEGEGRRCTARILHVAAIARKGEV